MLSEQNRPIVEATLPVVGQHIGAIAGRFYEHLFAAHPELMDGTFNRGNQTSGEQQQALAGSVAAFATALVTTPDALAGESAVADRAQARFAGHQPRPVPGRPRQSDVGDRGRARRCRHPGDRRCLGRGLLADGQCSDQSGARALQRPRCPTGDRVASWRVERKIRETADVVTFVVKRVDDRLVKTSLPGQYVTVKMLMPDGLHQPRQYSLTRADDGEHRQFSVKRVHGGGKPDGEVSTLLHDQVDIGDVLTLSLPYGDVVLDDAGRPVVFASAGMGISPMAGMLSHLVAAGSGLSITVLHADLDEASFALRRQVVSDVLALRDASLHLWYEKQSYSNEPVAGVHEGVMNLEQVDLPDDANYYLCGPIPFMQAVRSALVSRGVAPRDIQYEVFGPDLWQADLD